MELNIVTGWMELNIVMGLLDGAKYYNIGGWMELNVVTGWMDGAKHCNGVDGAIMFICKTMLLYIF